MVSPKMHRAHRQRAILFIVACSGSHSARSSSVLRFRKKAQQPGALHGPERDPGLEPAHDGFASPVPHLPGSTDVIRFSTERFLLAPDSSRAHARQLEILAGRTASLHRAWTSSPHGFEDRSRRCRGNGARAKKLVHRSLCSGRL